MVQSIDAQQALELIQSGTVELIDVRETNEWVTGHIAGARHAPLSRLRQAPKAYLQRDRLIFVCAAGSRSQMAAQLAAAHGFATVYNLAGGVRAWKAAGLQLVTPQQQATG